MQTIKFVTENWESIAATIVAFQGALGLLGKVMAKSPNPTISGIGHRLEGFGINVTQTLLGEKGK